jgi:uncharacterized protein
VNLPAFDPPVELSAALAPFWDAVAHDELRLPRCSACGRWQWYPDEGGTCCPGATLDWVRVEGRGVVHTFTVVRRAFLPSGANVPFVVAFIELDGIAGLRLVANVADDDIAIGDRVQVTFADVGSRRHPVFRRR